MVEVGTASVLNSSLNFSISKIIKGYLRNLLTPIPGSDHLWTLSAGFEYEVSEKGYTQVIVESIKDLVQINQSLVVLRGLKEAPCYILNNETQKKLTWIPGLAFDI